MGRDVFFGCGQYQPGTREGRRLIAHELTHRVQQEAAPGQVQREANPTALTGWWSELDTYSTEHETPATHNRQGHKIIEHFLNVRGAAVRRGLGLSQLAEQLLIENRMTPTKAAVEQLMDNLRKLNPRLFSPQNRRLFIYEGNQVLLARVTERGSGTVPDEIPGGAGKAVSAIKWGGKLLFTLYRSAERLSEASSEDRRRWNAIFNDAPSVEFIFRDTKEIREAFRRNLPPPSGIEQWLIDIGYTPRRDEIGRSLDFNADGFVKITDRLTGRTILLANKVDYYDRRRK